MNRSVAKTCTYFVMHLVVAIAVAYALTRDWAVALAIGLVEPIAQTIAFAVHERFWNGASSRDRTRGADPLCPCASQVRLPLD